jgi:DNA-binding transcriptional ArsR family regulator
MVKRSSDLDAIFRSLAHPVRRDILLRGSRKELSVSDLAKPYGLSLAAISRHISVLEDAKFVTKRREGKQFFVKISPFAFEEAADYLKEYERLWNNRLDNLERYLSFLPKMKRQK